MKNIALITLVWLFQPVVNAQFVDVTSMLGQDIVLNGLGLGSGISFYDINGDGWDDLTIGNAHQPIAIFLNNEGQLEPAPFSIPNNNALYVVGVLWGDLDNDGDADLLVLKNFGPVELWRNNGNNTFTEIATVAGINYGVLRFMGASFVDYDHDGLLDIYITTYHYPFDGGYEVASRLFRNTGNLTFQDATISSGIYVPPCPAFQAAFADFDGDGWEDMYLVVDRDDFENVLFHNNGNGTFTNVSPNSGANLAFCAMSATVGDFDNDRDLDVYVTGDVNTGNMLFQNESNFSFNEIAQEYNIAIHETGWGAMWLDFNNDSWQDLFVSAITGAPQISNNLFFKNGNGTDFSDNATFLGINSYPNETWVCAMGDINNDGFYDFAVNNRPPYTARLYQNVPSSFNYLSVSLKGTIANADGVGSWIHCYTPNNIYSRFTLSGENLYAQNSSKIIFGLGVENSVDSVVVEWNSGTKETYNFLQTNTHHFLQEGDSFIGTCTLQNLTGNSHLCPGETATLSAGNYNSYHWNTGESAGVIEISNPGSYFAIVTNQYGIQILSDTIVISWAPETEVIEQITHISCFGMQDGSIELNFSTGEPQNVLWGNNVESSLNDNLAAGIYSFIATDYFGCTLSDSYEIIEPLPISPNLTLNNVSCFGFSDGYVAAQPSGGTPPIEVFWLGYDPTTLTAGNYNYLLADINACSETGSFNISEPSEMTLELTVNQPNDTSESGSAAVIISGGTPPYSINWSNGQTGPAANSFAPGWHWVSILDFNVCETTQSFEIINTTAVSPLNPSTFSIFPNPTSNTIFINLPNVDKLEALVYNQLGAIVLKHSMQANSKMLNVAHLPDGVYTLKLFYSGKTSFARFVKLGAP